MNCPSLEELFAFAQNQLPAVEAEHIRAHLAAGCEACQDQFDRFQKMLAAAASRELVKPPEWLLRQAMILFTWNKTKPRQTLRERIPGLLLVDSFAEGPLPGFRSAGPISRLMLYRAGDYTINLSINYIEPTHAIDIIGQSMPLGGDLRVVAGAAVELLRESRIVRATRSNEFGAFLLDSVSEGVYDLIITLKEAEIDIPGLNAIVRLNRRRAVN